MLLKNNSFCIFKKSLSSYASILIVSVFLASCATQTVDDANTITNSEWHFSIHTPPNNWAEIDISGDELFSMAPYDPDAYFLGWTNNKGSIISFGATNIIDRSVDIFEDEGDKYAMAVSAYMQSGHMIAENRLWEICDKLSNDADRRGWSKPFGKNKMQKTEISSVATCKEPNPLFPVEFRMVGVWSDKYLYMFKLEAHEKHYERDLKALRNMVNSLQKL